MCDKTADEFDVEDDLSSSCSSSRFRESVSIQSDRCKKCDGGPTILLRGRDAYCTSCLRALVTHKFRSCLGKSKMMKSGEKVLIAYSGGLASTAMLSLSQEGLLEQSHKKLRFVPCVVHVDELGLLHRSASDRKEILKEMYSVMGSYGFPFYVTALEKIMDHGDRKLVLEVADSDITGYEALQDEPCLGRLQDLFGTVKSQTSKEDLLLKLRYRLLAQIARHLGCTKVFLGDTETRIAVRVLADMALGKGQHLSRNCGFSDDRYLDVTLVRPLRELLIKEVAFYVTALNVKMVTEAKLSTKHDSGASIQRRTESFVFGLQEEFSSTVSTIFRVGDKMGSNSSSKLDVASDRPSCILCAGVVDSREDSALSEEASKKDSYLCSQPECQSGSCHGPRRDASNHGISHLELNNLVCYSCRLILKETNDTRLLPPEVLTDAEVKMRRAKMRSEIADFLLDDDRQS